MMVSSGPLNECGSPSPFCAEAYRHAAASGSTTAEMGAFGLSISENYGGFASGDESDYIGMVVSTEELSRGSLGAGGSLVTRRSVSSRSAPRNGERPVSMA